MAINMAETRERNISKVVREYSSRLFRFIRGRVSSTVEAEDILQDVWYQFSNVVDVESIEQVSGWLFRVARNRITDNYRKKKNVLIDDLNSDEDEEESPVEHLMADFPAPEDDQLRELFWEELFRALEELPENQREVFVWNELEDETFQQISDRTGVNIKTLISRKRYAVQYLRERLQELYDEFLNY